MSQDADERVPRIVRRNPSKPVTKYCINCLSPLSKGSQLGGWLLPQDYYCDKCGYKGYVYLEDRRSEGEPRPGKVEGTKLEDREP